jgi:glutamate 5-kinase
MPTRIVKSVEENSLIYLHDAGTTSIVDEKTHLPLLSVLSSIAELGVKLRRLGHRVVIVSSGAVGMGMGGVGRQKRPVSRTEVQVSCF